MKIYGTIMGLSITFFVWASPIKAQEMETLSKRQEAIVPIASMTAKGDMEKLHQALTEGLEAGLAVSEIREVLTQLYAYAGFPRSLNALTCFMQVLEERKEKGVVDFNRNDDSSFFDAKSYENGSKTHARLTGSTAKGKVLQFAPAIDYYLKAHLFGDIFGRDNLQDADREIVTLSALTSLGGTESQFKSHLRIASNAGVRDSQIWQIPTILKNKVGAMEAWRAKKAISEAYEQKFSCGEPIADLFPRGQISTMDYFTGDVSNSRLVSPDSIVKCQVSNVTFKAGARTRWHIHTGTQILLCTAGHGWYQEKGKDAQELKAGSTVVIRPGTEHWHGASIDSEFSHVSIIPNPKENKDTWLDAVSEEEYAAVNAKSSH